MADRDFSCCTRSRNFDDQGWELTEFAMKDLENEQR